MRHDASEVFRKYRPGDPARDSERSPSNRPAGSALSSDLSRDLLSALPALALAAFLSFSFLGAKSFWLDEAYSVTFAQFDWRQEANMSLYYLILHYWLQFGTGEAVVRSLSALAAIASIVPFFVMCRSLFGRAHAVVASILLSLNAFFIQYAQEARSYSLALLLATASSMLLLRGLARPTVANWLAYVVVSSLAVYSHFFAALVILAHSFVVLVSRRAAIKNVLLSDLAIAALVSPLLLLAAGQTPPAWKKPPVRALATAFEDLAGHGGKALSLMYLLACCLGLYQLLRPRPAESADHKRFGRLFALSWLAVPILGTFVYSRLRHPMFVSRYLIVALPPLVMIAASGVVDLKWRTLRVSLFLVLVALSARGVVAWYRVPKTDWRAATAYVLNATEAGDVIVFQEPYERIPFEYYLRRRAGAPRAPQPLWPSAGWGRFDLLWPEFGHYAQEWLKVHPPAARRLWLILRHHWNNEKAAATVAILGANYSGRVERAFKGVRVVLYTR